MCDEIGQVCFRLVFVKFSAVSLQILFYFSERLHLFLLGLETFTY